MRDFAYKSAAAMAALSLALACFPVATTNAYYVDTETSDTSTFSAGTLDIESSLESLATTLEPGGHQIFGSTVSDEGSVPFEFDIIAENASCTPEIYDELEIEVEDEDATLYEGPLSSLSVATSTNFGDWLFDLRVPSGTDTGSCSVTLKFRAWQQGFAYGAGGFSDEEAILIDLSVRPNIPNVVLNEVMARPDTNNGQLDEWVELYNNSGTTVDLSLGWQISEVSGGENGSEQKYDITPSTANNSKVKTLDGNTVIQPHSWLVLVFNGNKLNNDGDTIRLYDPAGNKVDQYTYEAAKIGLSDARDPDGVGGWVDPVPTPGGPNIIEMPKIATTTDPLELVDANEAVATSTPETENAATTTPADTLATDTASSSPEFANEDGGGASGGDATGDAQTAQAPAEEMTAEPATDDAAPAEQTETGENPDDGTPSDDGVLEQDTPSDQVSASSDEPAKEPESSEGISENSGTSDDSDGPDDSGSSGESDESGESDSSDNASSAESAANNDASDV